MKTTRKTRTAYQIYLERAAAYDERPLSKAEHTEAAACLAAIYRGPLTAQTLAEAVELETLLHL